MKKRFTLDCSNEVDFTVLGINSHVKGYKLCWNINNSLKTAFEKKEDHNIEGELWFSRYAYICDEGVEYNLLANRSKKGHLITNQKRINYFLTIKNKQKKQTKKEFITKLSATKDILLVFEVDTRLIKNIERLIIK